MSVAFFKVGNKVIDISSPACDPLETRERPATVVSVNGCKLGLRDDRGGFWIADYTTVIANPNV
jgi:hypothetical protein